MDGKRSDVGGLGRLVIGFLRDLALRGAVLAENPVGELFEDAMLDGNMLYAGAARRGAY